MTPLPTISADKISVICDLYVNKKFSVREIAEHFAVSADAVTSFFRRHHIPRRSKTHAQQVLFERKPLSFTKQEINTPDLKELCAIGIMLYWAEGYKGNEKNKIVDFANSDPAMIHIFLRFFRTVYRPTEKKIKIYLYCYSDQNIGALIDFWIGITGVPREQFTKPYVRSDFREGGRKMKYGLVHVRYYDKRLLLDVKNMIQSYVHTYESAPIV